MAYAIHLAPIAYAGQNAGHASVWAATLSIRFERCATLSALL
jgi:hypothetical protein